MANVMQFELLKKSAITQIQADLEQAIEPDRLAAEQARNEAVSARNEVVGIKADIDARFLPDAATDPSTDGLVGGELYYNTALNAYRYFNGTVFDYVTPDGDYLLL